MSDYFEEGFCVRRPSWHGQETLLSDHLVLPQDREQAVILAGHDFSVIEVGNGSVGNPLAAGAVLDDNVGDIVRVDGVWRSFKIEPSKKSLYISQMRPDGPGPVHGNFLDVMNEGYGVIENAVGWDFAEAIGGEGAKVETGLTLRGGARCVITLYLDEPVTIQGDDSLVLPYLVVTWTHDGSGALSTRSTSVRVVCANTDAMASAEATGLGTDFTIRHTKNWRERVAEAKNVVRGMRDNFAEYRQAMEAYAAMPVSNFQRELFCEALVLDQSLKSVAKFKADAARGAYTKRVLNNVESAREGVLALFDGPTIPEAHKLTAYGLRLAGVEHFDHLRKYQSQDTYVGRQLLRTEPAKVRLAKLIEEVVAA